MKAKLEVLETRAALLGRTVQLCEYGTAVEQDALAQTKKQKLQLSKNTTQEIQRNGISALRINLSPPDIGTVLMRVGLPSDWRDE